MTNGRLTVNCTVTTGELCGRPARQANLEANVAVDVALGGSVIITARDDHP